MLNAGKPSNTGKRKKQTRFRHERCRYFPVSVNADATVQLYGARGYILAIVRKLRISLSSVVHVQCTGIRNRNSYPLFIGIFNTLSSKRHFEKAIVFS